MTPIDQFLSWHAEARTSETSDVNAMSLATATGDGRPSVRVVFYRGMSGHGLRFFTNQASRKGGELAQNPRCALVFHWQVAARQVRIEGTVERLDAAENDAYFAARPRGNQVAALVSAQSQTIDRGELEQAFAAASARYAGQPVPRPSHWGGYRVVPHVFEFWQSGQNRLHHRQRYDKIDGGWSYCEVAP
jgi:pyridoxamine 5'-phosphate oxidase